MDEQDIHFERSGEWRFNGKDEQAMNLMYLRRRAWKKDYFTSALPFAQAGPDVLLPLTGLQDDDLQLMVDYLPGVASHVDVHTTLGSFGRLSSVPVPNGSGALSVSNGSITPANITTDRNQIVDIPRDPSNNTVIGVDNGQLKNLMSNIGSATINELRRAFAAQRFLEATARGGSRYIEMLYSLFGVRSSDARLQRPEYLGGGVQDIVVSDVLQTSASVESPDQKSPQANQAGVGASIGRTASFKRYFEEPGYVMGIMSILPDASYMQGMPKQYTKFDRLDHYWPQFAHLGEQEIKQQELYFTGLPNDAASMDYEDTRIFGYTPRYAEYKYVPSTIHGDFREDLSFWHLGRIFNSAPALNKEFIWAEPRKDVFAVTDKGTHHFLFNIQHHFKAIRPMPRFGTPS
ncbi:major capsid protein [Microvirus sp.]|nr:major capsid protein [Microvirus sp.]